MATVIYKTYVITREYRLGRDAFRAESTRHENVTFGTTFENLIDWIDFLWDGKEPEGYFNKY